MKINFLLGFFCCLLVLSSCATNSNSKLKSKSGANQTNEPFFDTWGGHLERQNQAFLQNLN